MRHAAGWYGHYLQSNDQIVVKIMEPPAEKPKTYKAVAGVACIFSNDTLRSVSGRVILYFEKDSAGCSLRYGDELIIDNALQDIRNSGKPGAFDYRQYCARQNIFQQAFLHQGEWKKISPLAKPDLHYYLFLARAYCIGILQQYIPGDGSPGLAAALLIGYRDNVDPEILQAYADTGVVHVIAISGMHLGLIYMILLFLLRPLKNGRLITRYLKGIILLGALWAFSLLTGAPGSVLRSAVMFSVITAGRFFLGRESTTFNTLAVAAFLLLCYDPNLLFDVGFQLSYLAVGSIVIFQQPVYNLLSFRYLLPDKLWEMISISVAAQVLTTPVCLYYFHQFPLVFLASNIIAVPLSGIILIVLIVLIAAAHWVWAAVWIGKLAGSLITLMNSGMLWLDHFRWARITGIVISGTDVLMVYMIMAMLMVWLFRKQPRSLVWASVLILLLSLSIFFRV
jgi:competence protein ComEC